MTDKQHKETYLLGSSGAGATVTSEGGWKEIRRGRAYIQIIGTFVGTVLVQVSGDKLNPATVLTVVSAEGGYDIETEAGHIRATLTWTSGEAAVVMNGAKN